MFEYYICIGLCLLIFEFKYMKFRIGKIFKKKVKILLFLLGFYICKICELILIIFYNFFINLNDFFLN